MSELPKPQSVEAHYLAEIVEKLHRLTLAVERIDRQLQKFVREQGRKS